jgi:hypothetical protein
MAPENREFREKYQFTIPVVHINGKFLKESFISKNEILQGIEAEKNGGK